MTPCQTTNQGDGVLMNEALELEATNELAPNEGSGSWDGVRSSPRRNFQLGPIFNGTSAKKCMNQDQMDQVATGFGWTKPTAGMFQLASALNENCLICAEIVEKSTT